MTPSTSESQKKIKALVDDRLMAAYAHSTRALKSHDLILILDYEKREVRAERRDVFYADLKAFAAKSDVVDVDSLSMLRDLREPASTRMKTGIMKEAGFGAFWLFVQFSNYNVLTPIGVGMVEEVDFSL